MDKRQRLVVIFAVVLALAVAVVPDLLSRGGGAEQAQPAPAATSTVDEQDEGEAAEATQGNGEDAGAGGEATDPAATEAEPEAPPADAAPVSNSSASTPVVIVPDDGIELGEGITDARAEQAAAAASVSVTRDGTYTSKVEVALYIHTYGRVPGNYITKTRARNAGWVSSEGNLWDVCPGMSIGGGGYYNEQWGDEPLLPETPEGRDWRECDINYQGGYRGAERLVYSDDGLVFYTGDHYTSFERLY